MSNLFGGKTKTKSESEPWKEQQPYLKDAFSSAQNIYNSQKDTPYYQGDLYAGIDPLTASAVDRTGSYAGGAGAQAASGVAGVGSDLLGSSDAYRNAIGAYGAAASSDPTKANIRAAGAYASNPYLASQIDAASRDVTRNLGEVALPSIDREAVASGNINSSRAGVAEGIARRGAQDQIGDISASLRGNAYSQGLGLAESARTSNLSALGNTAGLYGGAVNTGLGAAAQGQDMSLTNLDAASRAGQIRQNDAQGRLNADFQRWQGQDTRASDLLARYYGIIGANNWGGTQTTTQSNNPGLIAGILGAGTAAAGIYSKLSGSPH